MKIILTKNTSSTGGKLFLDTKMYFYFIIIIIVINLYKIFRNPVILCA